MSITASKLMRLLHTRVLQPTQITQGIRCYHLVPSLWLELKGDVNY